MSYDDKHNPRICITCHAEGNGCCLYQPNMAEQMFGLTYGEILTISRYTGNPPDMFTIADTVDATFFKAVSAMHPIFTQILPNGNRIRLKTTAKACIFLGLNGCRLPDTVRPLFCRLYPFWLDTNNNIMVMVSPQCLAQKRAPSVHQILRRLQMSLPQVNHLFSQLTLFAKEHQYAQLSDGPVADIHPPA